MILYEEILKKFQKNKVKYILVGGIAFNLLGGYRHTLDMDILVEMSDHNLKKVVRILQKAGYGVKQPVDPIELADENIRRDWIKNKHMKAFNFYKGEQSYQEVDIIIDSPVGYESARKDMVKVKVGSLVLPVISIQNLIKMKKAAGRDVDLNDVEALKLIEKAKWSTVGKRRKKKS
jgi:hypothetical protein